MGVGKPGVELQRQHPLPIPTPSVASFGMWEGQSQGLGCWPPASLTVSCHPATRAVEISSECSFLGDRRKPCREFFQWSGLGLCTPLSIPEFWVCTCDLLQSLQPGSVGACVSGARLSMSRGVGVGEELKLSTCRAVASPAQAPLTLLRSQLELTRQECECGSFRR